MPLSGLWLLAIQFLPLSEHGLLSVSAPVGTLAIGSGPNPVWPHFELKPIIPVKTFFPNKVTVVGSRWTRTLGGTFGTTALTWGVIVGPVLLAFLLPHPPCLSFPSWPSL